MLPNRNRPARLARDTERVIEQASKEKSARPAAQSAAPTNRLPDYTRQNVEAVNYGDTRHALAVGVNKVVAPANAGRRYMFILNIGANAVNISFGKPADANTGIPLPSNGFYEPLVPPAGSINAFSAAGSTIIVVEG